MKRFLKVLFVGLILVINILPITVLAAEKEMTKDYRKFSQWDYSYGGRENIHMGFNPNATIHMYGCFLVGITINMGYANPDLRDFEKWNPEIASNSFSFDGSGALTGYTTSADPTFKYISSESYRGGALSAASAEERIQAAFDKGHYVVIEANPEGNPGAGNCHFSAVVLNADGTFRVQNSGRFNMDDGSSYGDSNEVSDWYARGVRQIHVWEGKVPSNVSMKSNADPTYKDNNKTMTEGERIKMENEILGMLGTDSKFVTDDAARITMTDRDSLSERENKTLESMKENIKGEETTATTIAIRVVSLCGLISIVYGVLLLVAFMFDRSNVFFDFSLVTVLSLGHIVIWDEAMGFEKGYNRDKKKLYVDGFSLFKRVVVLWIIGFLIVSGQVMSWIMDLLEWSGVF